MLWLALSMTPMSMAEPFLRTPDLHGNKLVFTSEGDLWVGDLTTGRAQRLTRDAGLERNASFSPDGSQIAFEAEYDGRQAYVMPTNGGIPKRLTYDEGFRAVTGWTPDGKDVLFRKSNVPTNYEYATVPATGGVTSRLPLEFASHVSFGPSRNRYAFTRFNRWYNAWFRYIGGMQNQIWTAENGTFKQITNIAGTNEYPVWMGDRIYFVNEKEAKFTLMSVAASGGTPRAELPATDVEIRELSTDGKRLVYERGTGVEIFDPATKSAANVEMTLESDLAHAMPYSVPANQNVMNGFATPTGKRVFVDSRGQILSLPFGEGEARVWKATPGVRLRHPVPSPDGKRLAYFSDGSGEMQLVVSDMDGLNTKQLTQDAKRQLVSLRWSPDGKWIAVYDSRMQLRLVNVESGEAKQVFQTSFNWFGEPFDFSPDSKYIAYVKPVPITGFKAIEIFEVATGKVTRVTSGRADDFYVTWSRDGKYLGFLSRRFIRVMPDAFLNQANSEAPVIACLLPVSADQTDPFAPKDPSEEPPKPPQPSKEMKIDFEGMEDRRIELPFAPGNIGSMAVLEDRILVASDGQIQSLGFGSRSAETLTEGGNIELTTDGSKLLLMNGAQISTFDLQSRQTARANFGNLRLQIEPMTEWKQMFYDAWRLLRDYFYVENMHGVDWNGIRTKYEAMLPRVRSRDELDELIRWMQAELGSSHQYLDVGDTRDIKPRVGGAYLGVDLEAAPNGYYRIAKILRGDGFLTRERSPLIGPGRDVREGMYLMMIGGQPIRVGEDPWATLNGRAGQTISVTVSDEPNLGKAKTYYVRPLASESRLRYLSWVEQNRKYVEKASNGRIGYVHLSAMTNQDVEDFIKQYFAQRDKEAIVVDSRFNNGGYVQDFLNRILNSSLTGFFNMRNSPESWTRQQDYFSGPIAVVQNEFNISCGEEFPHRFRDLKRGPIIGRRTMGGEVGSAPGWPLVDGGVISVPNYGMWVPGEGWVIEGKGVEPDIDVPSDPNAFVRGKDPQLDKAVEWLLNDLKKNPRPRPVVPKDRDRVKNPG